MKAMNPDWLLKYFKQITKAPDAIPRLRRFYLEYYDRVVPIPQMPSGKLGHREMGEIERNLPEATDRHLIR
jgi:hypothetical protein